jgi:hypothetical protein
VWVCRCYDVVDVSPSGRQRYAATWLIAGGELEVAGLDREDWQRIAELVTTYASLRLGGTDASVITLAERLGTTRIATLNHRHFAVVRPRWHACLMTARRRLAFLSAALIAAIRRRPGSGAARRNRNGADRSRGGNSRRGLSPADDLGRRGLTSCFCW